MTVRDPTTWVIWSVFLAALFGLALDPERLEMFRQCTGLTAPLLGGFNEAWLIVGRRGGKSIILALIAVFLAVFKDWSDRLVPGERGTVLVIAADRRQARVIFRYVTALITETPLIAGLVDGEVTQDRINLTNHRNQHGYSAAPERNNAPTRPPRSGAGLFSCRRRILASCRHRSALAHQVVAPPLGARVSSGEQARRPRRESR